MNKIILLCMVMHIPDATQKVICTWQVVLTKLKKRSV